MIEPNQEKKRLRTWALFIGLFLAILIAILFWLRPHSIILKILIAFFCTTTSLAIFLPLTLNPIEKGVIKFGHLMGIINTKVLLFLLFFLILFPIRLVKKIFSPPSSIEDSKRDSSYWVTHANEQSNRPLNQF